MLLGDLLEKIFIKTGIKWLVKKIVIDLLGLRLVTARNVN